MFAAAATDMNPKLIRERNQAALQGADHARCDARGMPIHAHHRAEGLEPERVGKAAQQLVAAIMMDDRFAHHRAEAGHAICQPLWHLPPGAGEDRRFQLFVPFCSANHSSTLNDLIIKWLPMGIALCER